MRISRSITAIAVGAIASLALLTPGAHAETVAAAPTSTHRAQPVPEAEPTHPDKLSDFNLDLQDPLIREGVSVEGGLSAEAQVPRTRPGVVSPNAATTPAGKALCTGKIQHPHWSKGAGGAVAKVNVTCTGTGWTAVDVRVRGLISFTATPNGTLVKRAESNKTQRVTLGGSEVVYYIPDVGSNAGSGNGYWVTTQTIQIVGPVTGTVGSETVVIQKSILPPGVV